MSSRLLFQSLEKRGLVVLRASSHTALRPLTQASLNLPASWCNARWHSEKACLFKALRNGLVWRLSLLHAWPRTHSKKQEASSPWQTPSSRWPAAIGEAVELRALLCHLSVCLFPPSFVVAHLVWTSREAEYNGLHSHGWPCCSQGSHPLPAQQILTRLKDRSSVDERSAPRSLKRITLQDLSQSYPSVS